jgi:hypothetical protein
MILDIVPTAPGLSSSTRFSLLFLEVLHEATFDGASLLSCESSASS